MAADDEQASSMLLELHGTAATLREEHIQSRELLLKAIAKDSRNAIALNNLAYIIDQQFPADLPQALDYSNRAVEIDPDHVEFLHTRGFILLHLNQWEAAIKDFRVVAARNPSLTDIHSGLAQAYRETGRADLAALHEMQAK